MPTSKSYHDYLIKSLQDPEEAAAYLEAVLEDCSEEELLLAVKNIVEARQNSQNSSWVIANNEITQRITTVEPKLNLPELTQLLGKLGFKLSVTAVEAAA